MTPTVTRARQKAREALAAALIKRSPANANIARNIVDGSFENFWVGPALDALERLVLVSDDEDDDEETGGP